MKKKGILALILLTMTLMVGCGQKDIIDETVSNEPQYEEPSGEVVEDETESTDETDKNTNKVEIGDSLLNRLISQLGKDSKSVEYFETIENNDALFVNESEFWLKPQGFIEVCCEELRWTYGRYINATNDWVPGNNSVMSSIRCTDRDDICKLLGIKTGTSAADIKTYLDDTYGEQLITIEIEENNNLYVYNVTDDCAFIYHLDGEYIEYDNTMFILKDYLDNYISKDYITNAGLTYDAVEGNYTLDEDMLNSKETISLRLADRIFTFSNLAGAEVLEDYMNGYYTGTDGNMNVLNIAFEKTDSTSTFPEFAMLASVGVFSDCITCYYDTSLDKEAAWGIIEEGDGYQIYRADSNYWMEGSNIYEYVIHFDKFDCNVNVLYSDSDEHDKSMEYAHNIIDYFNNYVTVEYIN